jgi:hypothetical protein
MTSSNLKGRIMCGNVKYIAFFLLIIQQPVCPNNITIYLDSGYCSGGIWVGKINRPSSDKIVFSDTVIFPQELLFSIVLSPEVILASGTPGFSYFMVFSKEFYKTLGYKFNQQIIKRPYTQTPVLSTEALNNPDTIWNSFQKCPDSLLILDSLNTLRINNKDTISTSIGMGKWCFRNIGPDPDFGCYNFHTYENYNAIIYAQCNDNRKMKLQVDKFHKFMANPNPPCGPEYDQIDSVHILWAADSMGNGIFKHPPVGARDHGARKFPGVSQSLEKINIHSTTNSIEFNLPSQPAPIKSLKIYSLNGSLVNQWSNPGRSVSWRTKGVLAGIYVADVQFQNQFRASRVFMIKKIRGSPCPKIPSPSSLIPIS